MVYSLKIMNIRLHFYDSLSNSGWDIWVDCQIKFAAPKPMQCYAKNKTKTAFCYYCWTLDIILVPVMIIFAICAMIFCMDVFDHKCITSPVRLQLCVRVVFFFSYFYELPSPCCKGPAVEWTCVFSNEQHPSRCLPAMLLQRGCRFSCRQPVTYWERGREMRDYSLACVSQSRSQSIRGQQAWLI